MDGRLEKIRRFEGSVMDFDSYVKDRIEQTKKENTCTSQTDKAKHKKRVDEKLNIKPISKETLKKHTESKILDFETASYIKEYKLVFNNAAICYDANCSVSVDKRIVKDGKLKIKFGIINGDFDCAKNELTTLEGAPKSVSGYFNCNNNKLTSLKGAPIKVGGGFDCSNNKLTTLEYAPNEIGEYFICSNNKLTSLKHSPYMVEQNYVCKDNELTSLEGAPYIVKRHFDCSNNKLTSLKGAPQKVGASFRCNNNCISSLEGAPKKTGSFHCNNNLLTSLNGAPQKIKGDFDCRYNQLITLEGAPQKVDRIFLCSGNPNLILPKEKPSWVKIAIIDDKN